MPQVSAPPRPKSSRAPHDSRSAGQQSQPRATRSSVKSPAAAFRLPLSSQNEILDRFARAFSTSFGDRSLPSRIQTLKGRLYDRDFAAAFGSAENRAAYTARWSPTRALAYTELILREQELAHVLCPRAQGALRTEADGEEQGSSDRARRPRVVTCLGGGAGAELVGLVAADRLLQSEETLRQAPDDGDKLHGGLEMRIFDLADWRNTLSPLQEALSSGRTTPMQKDGSDFQTAVHQGDVLQPDYALLDDAVRASALVTILFTLNELYAASLARTTAFLMRLGDLARPGTLLLVVDSPGSYSTIQLSGPQEAEEREEGKEGAAEKRRYPMQWLLDRTLLGSMGGTPGAQQSERKIWEKLIQDNARWFRKADGVSYPTELEDMRYQVHLFRRI